MIQLWPHSSKTHRQAAFQAKSGEPVFQRLHTWKKTAQ